MHTPNTTIPNKYLHVYTINKNQAYRLLTSILSFLCRLLILTAFLMSFISTILYTCNIVLSKSIVLFIFNVICVLNAISTCMTIVLIMSILQHMQCRYVLKNK